MACMVTTGAKRMFFFKSNSEGRFRGTLKSRYTEWRKATGAESGGRRARRTEAGCLPLLRYQQLVVWRVVECGGVEGAPWGAATAESEERRWLRVAGGVFNKKERKAVTEC
jgi:hypothetical protein